MPDPRTPYSISGIAYDVDGTTKMTSGYVTVFDTTLNENITGDIESDGSFSVNIANLTSVYSNGDKLQIVVYDMNRVKSTEFRHTVDTTGEGYNMGDVYLHWTVPIMEESRLIALILSNKDDSAEYTVDLYRRSDDSKLLSCDVGPNTSFSPSLGFKGILFANGICVIRETDTANTVEVTMVVK